MIWKYIKYFSNYGQKQNIIMYFNVLYFNEITIILLITIAILAEISIIWEKTPNPIINKTNDISKLCPFRVLPRKTVTSEIRYKINHWMQQTWQKGVRETHESGNTCLRTWTGLVNKKKRIKISCLLEMKRQEIPPGLLPPKKWGLVVLEIFGIAFRVRCWWIREEDEWGISFSVQGQH